MSPMPLRENIEIAPYSSLAEFYDYILRHVDYQGWYEYIRDLMLRYTRSQRLIVELGCGTGKFGAKFSNDDYVIFGIDSSLGMLRVAKNRAYRNHRVLCADMKRIPLRVSADFIFSVHDTMNYFLTLEDLSQVLASVRGIMHPETVFLFDMTTEYNINEHFDGKKARFNFRDTLVDWDNRYDREKQQVHSTFIFSKKNGTSGTEEHIQRIYAQGTIEELLRREGFDLLAVYGDHTLEPPDEKSVMINFITRLRR